MGKDGGEHPRYLPLLLGFPHLQSLLRRTWLARARGPGVETFLRFCHQHGVVNMPLDDLRLTPEEEARVGRVPMNYDPDQLVIATNYTPGMMAN